MYFTEHDQVENEIVHLEKGVGFICLFYVLFVCILIRGHT